MIGLKFTFPAGRYHATPWGRHVNEDDVAWPPEPYRILRSLIATWHRKGDQQAYPYERLAALIDALSEVDPVFRLPDSVKAHTRHYMPQGSIDSKSKREKTSLIIDLFLRLKANDPLLVGWDVDLDSQEFDLISHLARQMHYLGRAESIVIAEAFEEWPSGDEANARPRSIDADGVMADDPPGYAAVDILVPIKASQWDARRSELLSLSKNEPRPGRRAAIEATIPQRLVDALSVDTAAIQATKWSAPPAGRLVLYDRPPLAPIPARTRVRLSRDQGKLPTVARLVLAGRPRPSILDAVKIAETMRFAVMAKWRGEPPPAYITGRDAEGPLREAQHAHTFWLPEDADGDGYIDHIVLFSRHGFCATARAKIGELAKLWVEQGAPDDAGERGRKEWRLALEGFGAPREFAGECRLLKASNIWQSVTPYLRPRFGPKTIEETEKQIRRELELRGFPSPASLVVGDLERPEIQASENRPPVHAIRFRRNRSRRGLVQPDALGCSVRIKFLLPVEGPLALGFGAHFGLGLFAAQPDHQV